MSVYGAPLEASGAEHSLESEAVLRGEGLLWSRSFLENAQPHRLILKRGQQRMVLIRGWPEAGLLEAHFQPRLIVGLALTARDFARQGKLEGCGYAFISADDRPAPAFAAALRDLARANWSIDLEASRLVLVGGYTALGLAEQQQQQPTPDQQKYFERWKSCKPRASQRVEA
ncbi:MAG: hypothetical protein ACR2P3_03545 [Geminicoccaceae bacterium]